MSRVASIAALWLACVSAPALAQQAPASEPARASANAERNARPGQDQAKRRGTPRREEPDREAASRVRLQHESMAKPQRKTAASAPQAETPEPEPADAQQAEVHDDGDTQASVIEFSGVDAEGQLKTPQMLYFLNRLRAEFGRPRLPHRSFMPELERSVQGGAF